MYAFTRPQIFNWSKTATVGDNVRLTLDLGEGETWVAATVSDVTPGEYVPTVIVTTAEGSTREVTSDLYNNLIDSTVVAVRF